MTNDADLYERAKMLIPGGTQLLSKRPERFAPDQWPAYYQTARGCEVVDINGRQFIDMSTNCVGACLLGYANQPVDAAVRRRIEAGSICSLNSPDEVELAELLIELHPWADMVRYARTGGEALAIAVRIARAATGRETIAFCGYHGWHDWYLAANLAGDNLAPHLLPGLDPAGVPSGLQNTVFPFAHNDREALGEITQGHKLAAIVLEPLRNSEPAPGFLEHVRKVANENGAVLVVDEVSSGWKFCLGGAHLRFDVDPDIAVFAKSISNGYPMSAVVGRQSVMSAAERSFISSTYWTDGIGPAAAIATIRQMQQFDLPGHVERMGNLVLNTWTKLGQDHDVPAISTGLPQFAGLTFDHPRHVELSTLFTARMLDHGFLAGSSFYPTLAHQDHHVEAFYEAANVVFAELHRAIANDDCVERLGTAARQTDFQRLL